MAKRGGDFLGTILRAGMRGLDNVREVVVETGKQGKIQLDLTLLRRRRREVLAELGATTARLAADGRLDEETFPELGGPLSRLEAIDEEIAGAEHKARRDGGGAPAPRDDGDDDEEYDR
jgi:hypothetical protein